MNFRRVFLFAGLGGLIILAILGLGRFNQFADVLRGANWYVLGLIFLVQLASYFSNAKYYQSFFKIFDYKVPVPELYRIAITMNYVNQVFPSAGVSGTSFMSRELNGVPAGKATLAQLCRYIFTYLSFLAVLAIGFAFLFFAPSTNEGLAAKLGAFFIFIVVMMGVGIIILLKNRPLVQKMGDKMVSGFNKVARIFTRKKRQVSKQQTNHFFNELYHGFDVLFAKRGAWVKPLFYALAGNLAEVATVYIVFLAFGAAPNPGIVIAGYALANMAGLASFATLGIGAYEGAMIGSFVAFGIPFALAFAVTIVYRVLNMWLFMPIGFYFYRKSL